MIPSIAKFCPACGAPQQVRPEAAPAVAVVAAPRAAQPEATGPLVCPGCGIQRASQRRGCNVCTVSYEQPGVPMPNTGDTIWVGVRCQFQCRLCGHASPLNHLDVDGSVTCLRCGLDQVFDVETWIEGLDHAMRCGVLAGRRDEYKQLGATATALELVQNGMVIANGAMIMRSLRVAAGPGHPLCNRCHHPLEAELADDVTRTRCTSCGATQSCELPERATEMCEALIGVIAEELALDQKEAKIEEAAEADAINCGHCGAPLKVTGVSTIVSCEYCGASSRIPRRTMFKLGHDQPVPQLWWLAFSRSTAHRLAAPRTPTPSHHEPTRSPPPPPPPKPDGLGVLLALGVIAAVGVIGFRSSFARWRDTVRPPAVGSGSAVGSTKSATSNDPWDNDGPQPSRPETPEPRALSYEKLIGCRCGNTQLEANVARDGDRATLAVRAAVGHRTPFDLARFFTSSDAIGVGFACDEDHLIVAVGFRVASFSKSLETVQWDRRLGTPYRTPRGRVPRCRRLRVSRGKVKIPTKRGITTFRVDNGR